MSLLAPAALLLAAFYCYQAQTLTATLLAVAALLGWSWCTLRRKGSVFKRPTDKQLDSNIIGPESHPVKWTHLPSEGIHCANETRAVPYENEKCHIQIAMLHKPTHNCTMEKTNDYSCGDQLGGKKRIWEARFQLRFKEVPTDQTNLHFGLVLGGYVPVSGMARTVQQALVASISAIVGDFYHSVGDDPSQTKGEAEPPTFVMPLYAFDRLIVSDAGEEPDVTSDLTGRGFLRTDMGVKAYSAKMAEVVSNISKDKVYTFCFWGISRFLDCSRWEICGCPGLPGLRMEFDRLCGSPPVYIGIYSLKTEKGQEQEKRHLNSRKEHYFHIALWSSLSPPDASTLRKLVPDHLLRQARAVESSMPRRSGGLYEKLWTRVACCTARSDPPHA